MDDYTKTLILINSDEFTIDQNVQLFELIISKIEIDTIQGMADSEGISYKNHIFTLDGLCYLVT